MRTIGAALILFSVVLGCQQARIGAVGSSGVAGVQSASLEPAEELEILELVFRDLLENRRPGEVCFISLGDRDGVWIDAPDSLLGRLADLGLELKKPSDARFPQPGEMEPDGRHYVPIRDGASGRRGSVYWVRIMKPGMRARLPFEGLDEVFKSIPGAPQSGGNAGIEVETGRVGGPLDGGGSWEVVRKEGGRWMLDRAPGGVMRSWRS